MDPLTALRLSSRVGGFYQHSLGSSREDLPPRSMYTGQFDASEIASTSSMPTSAQSQPVKATRRRVPKACGECRRLKLKCDRAFPCQSCIKRGCEGICPEGSLVSGRGSRYILANTEQLHEKIVHMADRIRELEEALRVISEEHACCLNISSPSSDPPHPLLREDLLLIKNQLELYGPDRSQLASRSDSYASDGSDEDHSKQGNEHQHPPSSREAFLMSSETQFIDPQHAQYTGGGVNCFNTSSKTMSSVPLMMPQWSSHPQGLSQYHTGMHAINDNGAPQASYPSMANSMAAMNYQLQTYHDPNSSFSPQSGRDASAMHHSDETRCLSSASSAQNESAYYYAQT